MVYSESGLKVEISSKTTNTMKETILVDATNQNAASNSALENNTSQYRLLVQLS